MSSDDLLFDSVRAHLYTAVVGDILDQLGHLHQFLPAQITALRPTDKLVGRAMPVVNAPVYRVPAKPFGLLTEALDQLEPGEVYLGSHVETEPALWGELLSATARKRGAVGAVVDGYHRDTAQVLKTDYPVFSRGNYAQDSSARAVVQAFRVPVEVGQVTVHPGDLIFGDLDGVLVVPREIEAEVIERALLKASTENVVLKAIEEGMSSTEAFRVYGVL
jgi:4-hydroxy-4-methyl-2-oxoglutarate aldolase